MTLTLQHQSTVLNWPVLALCVGIALAGLAKVAVRAMALPHGHAARTPLRDGGLAALAAARHGVVEAVDEAHSVRPASRPRARPNERESRPSTNARRKNLISRAPFWSLHIFKSRRSVRPTISHARIVLRAPNHTRFISTCASLHLSSPTSSHRYFRHPRSKSPPCLYDKGAFAGSVTSTSGKPIDGCTRPMQKGWSEPSLRLTRGATPAFSNIASTAAGVLRPHLVRLARALLRSVEFFEAGLLPDASTTSSRSLLAFVVLTLLALLLLLPILALALLLLLLVVFFYPSSKPARRAAAVVGVERLHLAGERALLLELIHLLPCGLRLLLLLVEVVVRERAAQVLACAAAAVLRVEVGHHLRHPELLLEPPVLVELFEVLRRPLRRQPVEDRGGGRGRKLQSDRLKFATPGGELLLPGRPVLEAAAFFFVSLPFFFEEVEAGCCCCGREEAGCMAGSALRPNRGLCLSSPKFDVTGTRCEEISRERDRTAAHSFACFASVVSLADNSQAPR